MVKDIKTYTSFLDLLQIIHSKYEKLEEKNSLEFNIFKILKMTSYEVKTHSAFIANLLNKNGKHNKGIIFLNIFLKLLSELETENIHEYELQVEKRTTFGNIDIVLEKGDSIIIIENKIYAGDQEEQLERYYKYALQNYLPEQIRVIYLTLFGDEPSEQSLGKTITIDDVKCLSYKYDIRKWIESCIKEVALIANVREVLSQYIGLIEILTGKENSKEITMEIKDLFFDNKYSQLINTLQESIHEFNIELQTIFWQELKNKFDEKKIFKNYSETVSKEQIRNYYEKKTGSTFYGLATKLEETKSGISVYFKIEIHNTLYFGLMAINLNGETKQAESPELEDYITRIKNTPTFGQEFKNSKWWMGYKYYDQDLDFKALSNETYERLNDPSKRMILIEDIANQIEIFLNEYKNET